jgi:hypothetical protein
VSIAGDAGHAGWHCSFALQGMQRLAPELQDELQALQLLRG